MKLTHHVIGGILMVAGTTIGAAMLALPVSTGVAGFLPSVLLFVLYWLYMTFTAFLFLEVNMWMPEEANIISMAKHTLGFAGQCLSWVAYLFLLYALTTAYIAGSTSIFLNGISMLTGLQLPTWTGSLPLLAVFGWFIYRGTRSVDAINRLLMIGLSFSYVILIILLGPHVEITKLEHMEWGALSIGVSVVATSFGFHIIIPTLTNYLKRDIASLKTVIWIGSAIPLFVYLIWELFSLAVLPIEGPIGIIQGYVKGETGPQLLAQLLQNPWIEIVTECFAFFAIVTSFLGVSLSLCDFLADGLHIHKTRWGRAALLALSFIPPLAFTLTNPRAFLSALEYAGAFGVVILLGIIPALMVWRGRYNQHRESPYKAPGGKWALLITMGFSLLVIAIEIGNKIGWKPF